MKNCPFNGCDVSIEDRHFACPEHWKRVPRRLKLQLNDMFGSFLAEEITMTELKRFQASVLHRSQITSEQPCEAHALTWGVCPHCKARVVVPLLAGSPVVMSEVTSQRRKVVIANGDCFCIIGGVAIPQDSAPMGAYAAFECHACNGIDLNANEVEAATTQEERDQ